MAKATNWRKLAIERKGEVVRLQAALSYTQERMEFLRADYAARARDIQATNKGMAEWVAKLVGEDGTIDRSQIVPRNVSRSSMIIELLQQIAGQRREERAEAIDQAIAACGEASRVLRAAKASL